VGGGRNNSVKTASSRGVKGVLTIAGMREHEKIKRGKFFARFWVAGSGADQICAKETRQEREREFTTTSTRARKTVAAGHLEKNVPGIAEKTNKASAFIASRKPAKGKGRPDSWRVYTSYKSRENTQLGS